MGLVYWLKILVLGVTLIAFLATLFFYATSRDDDEKSKKRRDYFYTLASLTLILYVVSVLIPWCSLA